MKPPLRIEAERIAGTLSEPMKAMLLRARCITPEGLRRCYGPANTRAALRDRGLGHGDYVYLTTLGINVREVLLSQEQTDER